jgi:hypothetical protein
MPVCEGRSDGPCPDKRNDCSVHLSQGDLMLCDAREKVRFPCVEAKDRKPGSHAARKRKSPKIVLNDLALIVLHQGQRFLKMNTGLP